MIRGVRHIAAHAVNPAVSACLHRVCDGILQGPGASRFPDAGSHVTQSTDESASASSQAGSHSRCHAQVPTPLLRHTISLACQTATPQTASAPWHSLQRPSSRSMSSNSSGTGGGDVGNSGKQTPQQPPRSPEAKESSTGSSAPTPNTPPSSPPSTPAPSSAMQSAQKTFSKVLPKSIRRLLPGWRDELELESDDDRRAPAPSPAPQQSQSQGLSTSSTAATAGGKDAEEDVKSAAKKREELIDNYKDLSEMDLNGFREFVQTQLLERKEPPVQLPPVPMWHKDYPEFVDFRRALYLRTKQHVAILESLTEDQQLHILKTGVGVLRDLDLLTQISQQTRAQGVEYMELEVRDCLKTFFEYRKMGRRMLHWMRDLNQPEPKNNQENDKIMEAMEQIEARDWLINRLKDCVGPENCELHRVRGQAGRTAVCQHTHLQYRNCCGGNPLPMSIALVHMRAEEEGLAYDSHEYQKRLREVTPLDPRFFRRPRPINHLLPPNKWALRRPASHRFLRAAQKREMTPKFVDNSVRARLIEVQPRRSRL